MNSPATLPPTTWTTGSTEVFHTGTWRAALPRHLAASSPCRDACPVHGDIAEWIGLARDGDLHAAWEVLTRHNPFPAVAGRVCHHPCESACNRAALDAAVSICQLERHVGDAALAAGWALAPAEPRHGGHAAIVGAGPAGLSAAYQLLRRGWRVTVFDADDAPGGLLRRGIPDYRLPREVLDGEIARIVALGLELRCGAPVRTPAEFDALRAAHDAVFVASGAALSRRLPPLEYDGRRVIDGAAYLRDWNAGAPPALGSAVVVIGGGSAALDAARSARRAGHDVTLLALEPRARMPAQPDEIDEAIEEGIVLRDAAMLERLEPDGDRLVLHCMAVTLRSPPPALAVEPLPGGGFTLRADAVITSIGQQVDLAPFGRALADGALVAADRDGATPVPGVWAGGDAASLARQVTEAIGMGRRTALAIDARRRGLAPGEAAPAAGAPALWYHDPRPRAQPPRADAAARLAGGEVQQGLDAEAARAEAMRCFSCGHCVHCDTCVVVCPDLAVLRLETGYTVLADYCKGCGLCVRECPTGAMAMAEEAR